MNTALIVLIVLVILLSLFILWYWWYWNQTHHKIKSLPLHDLRHALICYGAFLFGLGLAWWKYETMLPVDEQNGYLQLILGGCSLSALFCCLSMLIGRYCDLISKS